MRLIHLSVIVGAAVIVFIISQILLEVYLEDDLWQVFIPSKRYDYENLFKEVTQPVVVWWAPLGGPTLPGLVQQCGQRACYFTNDREFRHHPQLKAFMFYGSSTKLLDLPLPRNGSSVLWALLHEESPRNNAPLSHLPVLSLFNFTSTFSRLSSFPLTTQYLSSLQVLTDPKFFVTTQKKSHIQKEERQAPVLYLQSDCSTPTDRDSYVVELAKHIPVDSYGECLHNKDLPPHLQSPHRLDTMMSDDLLHLVSKYKFMLAFENGICDDYVTEKLWRPLISGTVPVYIGSPTVSVTIAASNAMASRSSRTSESSGRTLFLLNYTITPEKTLTAPGYDGIVYISSVHPEQDKSAPEAIRDALLKALKVDGALFSEGGVLEVNLPAGRMVYSPTEALTDFHDVRSYGEAARKGLKRALKAKFKSPLLIVSSNSVFPNCDLVTILGALEALYINIQYREDCPDKSPKVKNLGVWSSNYDKILKTVELAKSLENGRIVARDIGDSDPERMTPIRALEYVKEAFPEGCGITVVSHDKTDTLAQMYPLYGAVNRAASVIERHQGRVVFLHYDPPEGSVVTDSILLVGKGVTYDTGGADIKAGGVMAGMSRDKCGAAAVAGFMKVVSELKPKNIKVIAALSLVRNSVGENSYVADEVIRARSGKRVRVGNTDAEGRMIMADVLCHMKEIVKQEGYPNPYLMTLATLTGHAILTVGDGYNIAMDNGPAYKNEEGKKLQKAGDDVGDPFEISRLHKDDFDFHKGKMEGDDILQANNKPSVQTLRGHQGPAAFLILASGLDQHGLDSSRPIKYSHLDIAGGAGCLPNPATGSPVLALAKRFLLS